MPGTTDNTTQGELSWQQRQRNMNRVIVVSIATMTSVACLGDNVLSLAAIKLGAKERFIGFLTFALIAPLVMQIFTISAVEKIGKKRILLIWFTTGLLFVLPVLFIPQIASLFSADIALILLFACTFLWKTCDGLANSGWFPILQDSVPSDIVGKFFARLRTSWQAAWLTSLLIIAWFLGGDNPEWWRFQLIFAAGFIAFAVKPIGTLGMSERTIFSENNSVRLNLTDRFRELFSKKEVRIFTFYSIFYTSAYFFVEPFKVKFMKDLGYSDSFVIAATAAAGLGAITSLWFWGRLADRFGNRGIFSISQTGMIMTSFLWVIVGKSTFGTVLILTLYFFTSVFSCANDIAQTRYMLHAVPINKQYYMNLISVLVNFFASLTPIAGGFFLYKTEKFRFRSGVLSFNNYDLFFIITALLFVIPFTLRKQLRVGKETATKDVIAIVMRPLRNTLGILVGFNKSEY
jgi:MFS family permease